MTFTGFAIGLIVIVLGLSLHEFGHALAADRLGDPGPRAAGRLTIRPDRHMELFGFVFIVITLYAGFGLGWAKPVMVNPRWFRRPKRDMMLVALAGPAMNLAQALAFALALRLLFVVAPVFYGHAALAAFILRICAAGVILNIALMLFNLLPIFPLDGSKVVAGLMPDRMSMAWTAFGQRYGALCLIGLFLLGGRLLGNTLEPATFHLARLLMPAGLF
ncbi:MAG: site-2 protease family protein [Armatimonadetes bacterium]|nr:site-2 protease family protein [Armatimonadota bacterium]MDE2207368.1 site-2 protease family protein [Armatimonadota bacterium]